MTLKLTVCYQPSVHSTGTFAVISIMVGKVVNKYSTVQQIVANSTDTSPLSEPSGAGHSPMEIATLVCFMVGVIQVTFPTNCESMQLTNYRFTAGDVRVSARHLIIPIVGVFG